MYYAKVQVKSSERNERQEKFFTRIILKGGDFQEWCRRQREDPSLAIILHGKETGVRSPCTEIPSGDVSAQIYWTYWDALINGILYKKWEAPNLEKSFLQLVVPQSMLKKS